MASSDIVLANPLVEINNETIPVVPNSVRYTEGFGEQTMRTQSVGNGNVKNVYAQNVETRMSTFSCTMESTPQNIALIRTWKSNGNGNVIVVTSTGSNFSRTFLEAALTNNYEVGLGSDKNIELEFHTRSAT